MSTSTLNSVTLMGTLIEEPSPSNGIILLKLETICPVFDNNKRISGTETEVHTIIIKNDKMIENLAKWLKLGSKLIVHDARLKNIPNRGSFVEINNIFGKILLNGHDNKRFPTNDYAQKDTYNNKKGRFNNNINPYNQENYVNYNNNNSSKNNNMMIDDIPF